MWSRRLDQRKRWRSISYILLEWIIQSLSHAAVNHPPKGGLLQCAQEHSDPRGAGYLSTPTDQSVPANGFTPSPSTFHSCMCVWCVCGGESLPLPLNHGGPWGRPVTSTGAFDPPPLLLTRVLPSLVPCFPLSPSLVAVITLHVPCPFNLATKGRQAGEARD